MHQDIRALNELVQQSSAFVDKLISETQLVIVGQKYMIERALIGLITGGHVLIEGVPGLAKTLTVKTLAETLTARFTRIQFTPDMLPADVIGTVIYNQKTGDFSIRRGPIFANLVLADEINRAPAKVQSALLEAMQERQVTIGDETYSLPEPFLVLATQNPVEQEGTYPLPEAQVDRFMFKCLVSTPEKADERRIMQRFAEGSSKPEASAVCDGRDIADLRSALDMVYCDEKVGDYILDIVFATRGEGSFKGAGEIKSLVQFGASPRATIALNLASRANALVHGRAYATPQDVKEVVYDVLRHRILLTYEAEAENVTSDEIVRRILDLVPVP